MNKHSGIAIGLSLIALVLAFVALLSGGERAIVTTDDAKPDGTVDALSKQVASLAQQLVELRAQQKALADARTDGAAGEPMGPEKIGAIVDERVFEAVARASGRARMSFGELPEDVKAAAANVLGGAKFTKAELRNKNGRAEFRLRARLDGENYDLKISPKGEIVEAEMPPARAPAVVTAAALKAVAGIEVDQVVLEFDKDEGLQVYDVEGKVDGKQYDMIITLDGQVIEIDGPDGKQRFDIEPPADRRPQEAF